MNTMLRRTWLGGLVVILAALYGWVGLGGPGLGRALGLLGALMILAALAAARRSRATAGALLAVGGAPAAVITWWSLVTPLLAVLTLLLGWSAVRTAPATPAKTLRS